MVPIIFFLFFLHGCRSWELAASHSHVHEYKEENVTLTCRPGHAASSNFQRRLTEVTRIEIRKLDHHIQPNNWRVVAKVLDANRLAVLVQPGQHGMTAHGDAGSVADSYLSVRWEKTSQDTPGTYVCQVNGLTREGLSLGVRTSPVTLAMAQPEWRDLLKKFFNYEKRSEEIHAEGMSLLKALSSRLDGMHCRGSATTPPTNMITDKSSSVARQGSTKHTTQITTRGPTKERIQWPGGQFCLLMPDTGCPNATSADEKWFTGYARIHIKQGLNPDRNPISNPSHMPKPVVGEEDGTTFFFMRTCGQTGKTTSSAPAWPKGSYCVIRESYEPLNGFHHGSISLDTENARPNLNRLFHKGAPFAMDGTSSLELFFWCRADGLATDPIELPVDSPFYLYRRGGRCQEVRNATVTEESYKVVTESSNNRDERRGVFYPDVLLNPVRFNTCYYQPIV